MQSLPTYLCSSPDSFHFVHVQLNLFKLNRFPPSACSTAAQRAVLVASCRQGQSRFGIVTSCLMETFEISCGSTEKFGQGKGASLCSAMYKEEDPAPVSVQLK